MTRQCRHLLKKIRQYSSNTTFVWNCDYRNSYLYRIDVKGAILKLPEYSGELDSLIAALVDSGHITKAQFGYKLTHKGLHPVGVSIESAKLFLLKSVIVPIVVAAITALITMWLKGLL